MATSSPVSGQTIETRDQSQGPCSRRFRRIAYLGSPGPVLLAFARTCKQLGVSTYLLEIADRKSSWANYSNSVADVTTISPRQIGTTDGAIAIGRVLESIDADALIAVADKHLLWLSQHREHFPSTCHLLMPPYSCLSRLASKVEQIHLAREAGFELLPTTYLSSVDDANSVPPEQFPICLRPSEPEKVQPRFKARVIHSQHELLSFLRGMSEIRKPIIAQPFLNCPDLKVHGIRSEDGRILAMQPFFVERKFQGVTLTLTRTEFPPGVRASCERFAELAELDGGFHFDLLYAKQQQEVFYLEVNARMGGITDKAKAFGYDQPRLILEAYGDSAPHIDYPRSTSRRRVVTKRAVAKHLLKALTGQLTELDYPPVGRMRHVLLSIRDLVLARDSVFDRKDLYGTLWFNLQKP